MPNEKPQKQPAYLIVGKLMRPHGIRGEMRMSILTDYPDRLFNEVKTVYLGHDANVPGAQAYTIVSARYHKDHLLLKFKDLNDRDDVELLRGLMVMVDMDNAVPLEDDEFYLYELIGMQVQTDDGLILGNITDVMETGANDVYIVHGDTYGEVLVPAHDETILDIDLDAEQITVKLPEGLLKDPKSKT